MKEINNVYSRNITINRDRLENSLILGSAGSGKGFAYINPNIKDADNYSMLVIDSNRDQYNRHKDQLTKKGYEVKLIDFVNTDDSVKYNPFAYVDQKDVDFVSRVILSELKKTDEVDKNELFLLKFMIFYMMNKFDVEERNFAKLVEILEFANSSEKEEPLKILNIMIDKFTLDVDEKSMFDLSDFDKIKENDLKNALYSCYKCISELKNSDILTMTNKNNLDLDLVQDKKMAIFVNINVWDNRYSTLEALMILQTYNNIIKQNKDNYKYPVRIFIDELQTVADSFKQIDAYKMFISKGLLNGIFTDIIAQSIGIIEYCLINLDFIDNVLVLGSIADYKTTKFLEVVFKDAKLQIGLTDNSDGVNYKVANNTNYLSQSECLYYNDISQILFIDYKKE